MAMLVVFSSFSVIMINWEMDQKTLENFSQFQMEESDYRSCIIIAGVASIGPYMSINSD